MSDSWEYVRQEAEKEQCLEVIDRCRKWAKRNVQLIENENELRMVPVQDIQGQLVNRSDTLKALAQSEPDESKRVQLLRSVSKIQDLLVVLSKVPDKKALLEVGGEFTGKNLLRQSKRIMDQALKLTKSNDPGLKDKIYRL